MFYDLNIPYTASHAELQRILAFSAELGYNVVALNHTITGKLPAEITNAIPSPLPFNPPSSLTLLRRCTIALSDPAQNARLATLAAAYDLLALRPLTEKSLGQACHDLECDIISIDLSIRYPFYFKHKMVADAVKRGIKFEICYAPGILAADGGQARRNLISNATGLIRATRGRGLIISSEAGKALAVRGPSDLINLACVWGLGQERGTEAVGRESRSVVVQARLKRTGYRGVVDILYGGEKPVAAPVTEEEDQKQKSAKGKRKAVVLRDEVDDSPDPKPISKREQKRRAKKARKDAVEAEQTKAPAKSIDAQEMKTTGST
ncbi:MAG: hypothetical protein Q9195_003144 [Heterodermia aff. obscurata]